VADDIVEHPALIAIYDALDPDHSDLDVYAGIAEGLGARQFLTSAAGPARSRCFWPTAVSR
jgi:hypothetical protein